jgi:hypothetical protein
MLTKKQVMAKFECDKADALEILLIQEKGFAHGLSGRVFDADGFEDEVGLDIEHVSTLMMADEDEVRAVYDAALVTGEKRRALLEKSRPTKKAA